MTRAALCPLATTELLPTEHGGLLLQSLGLVEHVTAGNGDPYSWWNQVQNASAHFYNPKAGPLRQEVDARDASWAQMAGNYHWHSMETEGEPWEPLTDNQVDNSAALYAWGHQEWGWQLLLSDSPATPGFGWHGMGGKAWGAHPGCPGELRKAQRGTILARAAHELHLGGHIPQHLVPVVGSPAVHSVEFSRMIYPGMVGADVRYFQWRMHQRGWWDATGKPLSFDGVYGPLSVQVVEDFQRQHGLAVDGIIGHVTWWTAFRTDNLR